MMTARAQVGAVCYPTTAKRESRAAETIAVRQGRTLPVRLLNLAE